jgi:putative SOS response-associated peptidase YedK
MINGTQSPFAILPPSMCGRYTITIDKSSIERRFNAKFATGQTNFEPTYNAAPSQLLPIIRTYAPGEITLAKWGFIPEGWTSSHIRPPNNARLETARDKPMFRESFSGRHCMVLADSFYEWKTMPDGRKKPYRFVMKTGEPFAMAGIYARDHNDLNRLNFAILTTSANAVMEPIHDRMPVILPLGSEKKWLPASPSGMVVFPKFPAEFMTAYPVTPKMNRATFNVPEAIAPL